MESINDPDNYSKMREPFASPEAADEAIKGFYSELYELRNKYRIADVLTVVSLAIRYPDGPGEVITSAHFGDELRAETMAAWSYGHEAAVRQERVAKMVSQACTAVEKPRRRK